MDVRAVKKLLRTNEYETRIVESFIAQFGFKDLARCLKTGFPVLDLNHNLKSRIGFIYSIVSNDSDALAALAKLTDIPYKTMKDIVPPNTKISEVLNHPEWFDLDTRQLYNFRCMHNIYVSYNNDLYVKKNRNMCEEQYYEMER